MWNSIYMIFQSSRGLTWFNAEFFILTVDILMIGKGKSAPEVPPAYIERTP
jgi:hypothetical protein